MRPLGVHLAVADPSQRSICRYAFDTLADWLDLVWAEVPAAGADIHYGEGPSQAPIRVRSELASDWRSETPRVAWREGVPLLYWEREPAGIEASGQVDADLVLGLFYLLSGWEETRTTVRDRFGRFPAQASFLTERGLVTTPVANAYAALLRRMLAERLGMARPGSPYPGGKSWTLLLSHDVDNPEPVFLIEAAKSLVQLGRQRGRQARPLVTRALEAARPGAHWCFDAWMDLEQSLGVRSAFYFAVENISALGKLLSPGNKEVLYKADGPRIRRQIRRTVERGFEVGLHASFGCQADGANFVAEKHRLEELAGCEVEGLRHHYYMLRPGRSFETLRHHHEAGLGYDTSLVFAGEPGFRRSVALPYHPIDPETLETTGTLQIPTTLMDAHLAPTGWVDDREAALARAVEHAETVRAHGGIAVLDWHVRMWNERSYPHFRALYEGLVRHALEGGDAWVTTPGELTRWWSTRAASRNVSSR